MSGRTKAEIETELRSVVQSIKEGIPLQNVQRDFRSLTGNGIPYEKFGYSSLEGMLQDMPHVIRLERNERGEAIVRAVANQATEHLAKLISKQRSCKPKSCSKPRSRRGSHKWRAPHTPDRVEDLPSRAAPRHSKRIFYNTATKQAPINYQESNRQCFQPSSSNQNTVTDRKPKKTSKTANLQANKKSSDASNNPSQLNQQRTNRQLVDNYVFTNDLQCIYRPFEHKKKWLSVLILDDQKFLSYPVEKKTADEANEEAARKAVEKLNITSSNISLPYAPVQSADDIKTVAEQVKEIVLTSSEGVYHKYVQDQFRKRHKMRLPPNWIDLIQNLDSFHIESTDEAHFVVFYNFPHAARTHSSTERSQPSPNRQCRDFDCFPDTLPLPVEKNWGIFVTHSSNTANVCFRLIDHADIFEKFAQSMEDYYIQNRHLKLLKLPVCNGLYCAFVESAWHRVIVRNTNDDGMVLCDFPDVGDAEWLPANVIYELDKKFLKLPFQAFRAELAGLSCFQEDSSISETLINLVLGKALIAEPASGDDDNIMLVLYDTSTDEDVNINKVILEEVFAAIKPPALLQASPLLQGVLGGVEPNGIIKLQLLDRSAQLLNSLLDNVAFMLEEQTKVNPVTKLHTTKTYAVLYHGKWHRAKPASQLINVDKVSMFLIDFGRQVETSLKNVCELEGKTAIVASFPALAVPCYLNGLSSSNNFKWNSKATQKLFQLIPEGTPLLIKVASATTESLLPLVDLFKRLKANLELVSINQTLAVEFFGSSSFSMEIAINEQEEIPRIGEYFDVYIASASKPDKFTCQSIKSRDAISTMYEEMQQFYNCSDNLKEVHETSINVGEFYALKYKDDRWYRIHIQEILDRNPFLILVYLVDYGGFEIARSSDIQGLAKKFRRLRYQAISASLSGVKPIKPDYSPSDCTEFKKIVEGKSFVSVVDARKQTNLNGLEGIHLTLTLIDTSTDVDLYIRQELLTKGIATVI